MDNQLSAEDYSRQLRAKYGGRRKSEFDSEYPTVKRYYEAVLKHIGNAYTIEKVLAVGGTGIVHLGHHNRFPQQIVLKFNRPNIEVNDVSMVEHEAKVLPTLNHPNIVRVLDRGEGEFEKEIPKLTYVVEPFIGGSKAFFTFGAPGDEEGEQRVRETWLYGRLTELTAAVPAAPPQLGGQNTDQAIGLVSLLLADLAALFSQWVSLLDHLHSKHDNAENGYVYLDVKPENVLVDEHRHLTSIDYGSVEQLDPDDPSPIEVFFTERYAHPELINRKLDKPSANRVRGGLKRSELTRAFDYFSLGVSMLQILHEVALTRPHVVPQIPLYRSLHFLATRLLDGQNSGRRSDDHYSYASQVFPSLKDSDYAQLAYTNLTDTHRDLEKERGRWNLENEVPELASYSKDIVRLVPGFNTVLTPRLRRVIEHPLVARLKCVTQLGLVSLVYPTADHSRYDHALGSYTYTTYYVKSLFNDLGNPLFRNLVGAEDLNALLLAALLHDLGQYPLAHDLEEVHASIFKHGRITELLLDDPTPDQYGRTLLQIIEDPQNGWGVRGDDLRRILRAHSKNLPLSPQDHDGQRKRAKKEISLKIEVLASIVDGPVDADKADYIIRDSARCELPYGRQLDMERLLRVLTLAILPEDVSPGGRVTLGVYDKGTASAHAFGQARYLLFSTVYWHHTSRITKAMLQYATVMGLPREVFGPTTSTSAATELAISERLLQFIKALVPPFEQKLDAISPSEQVAEMDMAAEPPQNVLAGILQSGEREVTQAEPEAVNTWYPGVSWTDWLMLKWIGKLPAASKQSWNLLHGLQVRRLYKRIATFTRGGPHRLLVETLNGLTWPDRLDACEKLHKRVYETLRREWAYVNTQTTLDKPGFETLCKNNLLILIDIPNPAKKVGYDRPLGIVPELKEKSYYQHTRQASEDEAWRQIMSSTMAGIAPVRILCHPEIRNVLGSIFAPVEGEPPTKGRRGVEAELASDLREILGP